VIVVLTRSGWVDAQWWPRDFQNCPDRFCELTGKVFDRPGTDLGQPLITDSVTNEILFSSDDLTDLGQSAGVEIRFGSLGRCGRLWEARTGFTEWSEEYNFIGDNLQTPLAPGFEPDEIDVDYESDYFTVDFSLKRVVLPGFTLLVGPRFVSLREDLSFETETTITTPFGDFDLLTENEIHTRNPMIGIQIGGEFNMPISRDIYVNGFIRSSGMSNFTELQTREITTITDEVLREETKQTGTFIGEVGGRIYTDLIPNCLSGFIGYEATWIDGVALAPTQGDFATTGAVFTGVTPFFQAITFGLRYRH
jgi:hypothetical protein